MCLAFLPVLLAIYGQVNRPLQIAQLFIVGTLGVWLAAQCFPPPFRQLFRFAKTNVGAQFLLDL
jgi:hypothetical protein